MKLVKRMLFLFTVAALTIAMFSVPLSAQQLVAKVQVPFQFQAAGKTMPAGDYTVATNVANGLVSMADVTGHKALLPGKRIEPLQEDQKARLVFQRTGEKYSLTTIWTGPGRLGYEVPAAKKAAGERVEIAVVR